MFQLMIGFHTPDHLKTNFEVTKYNILEGNYVLCQMEVYFFFSYIYFICHFIIITQCYLLNTRLTFLHFKWPLISQSISCHWYQKVESIDTDIINITRCQFVDILLRTKIKIKCIQTDWSNNYIWLWHGLYQHGFLRYHAVLVYHAKQYFPFS